jgi:ubiquinone biosynthesis protein COQ4
MRLVRSLRLATRLARRDLDRHLADVAVLKSDAFGVGHSERTRSMLAPVTGYVPPLDLEALAALPEGTFGRAYARFMQENALSPFILTDAIDETTRERNVFGIRYATTHDMIHVLTGFDTSWAGELGVLAFAVAQRYTGWQRFGYVLAWVLYPFFSRFRVRALLAAARRGNALGRRARCVLAVRLEEQLDRPIDEVRASLGIELADAP